MLTHIVHRVLQTLVVLGLASVVIFVLIRMVPGDPAVALAGPDASPETIQAISERLALDQPLPVQYLQWMGGVVRGDLGQSISARRPVTDLIWTAFPASLQLAVAALLIAVLVGLVLGVAAAVAHRRWPDVLIGSATSAIIGIPAFWLGMIGLVVFSLTLDWLPPGGWVSIFDRPGDAVRSLLLPATAVGLVQGSILARFMRASMLDALEDDHVRTAHAKGLRPPLVLWRHAFRNALIPVITVLGAQAGNLLGGIVVIEIVFSWPGLGRLIIGAVGQRDYPVVQATLLLLITVFVVINLVVDILYGYLDPRTREAAR